MNKTIVLGVLVFVIGVSAYAVSRNASREAPIVTNPMTVTSGENPQPGGIHDLPVEPAAAKARADLAATLSVDEKSIVIMQISDTEWTDGCLGLGQAHESCLQALVPGFKVELLASGKTYLYRTDKTGDSVRAEVQ